MNITDAFKPAIELPGCLQIRNKDQIVVFSSATGFFIDITDLSCQNKTNSSAAGGRHTYIQRFCGIRFQSKKPGFGWIKLAFDLGEPGWMAEVPGSDQLNPLDLGGFIEIFQIKIPRRGPGIFGMDMQVCNYFHLKDLACQKQVNTLYIYVIFILPLYMVVLSGIKHMGLLSSAVSITRYRVEGKIDSAVTQTVANGLKKNAISEIDAEAVEKSVGWTSFGSPFQPNFEGDTFTFGNLFIFSLRIDRKSIPAKLLKKHITLETSKRLDKTRRRFLSKDEKQALKDKVTADLAMRVPSTPNVYDLIWNYEKLDVYFFSNLRSSNEELESLFKRSFNLSLIRVFPYTAADLLSGLSDRERDILLGLSPTQFSD